MRHFLNFLLAANFLAGCGRSVQSGLDTGFGTSGGTTVDIGSGTEDKAYAVVSDSASATYTVGYTVGATKDFAIVKLTSAGALDTTFNTTGKTTADFSSAEDTAYAVSIQSNGKIVAAGNSTATGATSLAMVRWNTDGSLDTTFGTSGKLTQTFGSGNADYRAMVLDTSDRILIAGSATLAGRMNFILARFTADGTLDTTFGSGGSVTVTPGTIADYARAIGITSTRIYVAGTQYVGTTTTTGNFALTSYLLDGSLDTGFGTAGVVSLDFETLFPGATRNDLVQALSIDSNSRILVSGTSSDTAGTRIASARYSSVGVIDTSYGISGGSLVQVTKPVSGITTSINVASTYALLGLGSYFFASTAATTPLGSIGITKMTSSGDLNTGFGTGGFSFIADGSYQTEINASTPSGSKWILAGNSFNTSWNFAIFRYRP